MMELRDALIDAITGIQEWRWMSGARIVREENGSYSAIPGAYLTDISYTGSREVVYSIESLDDFGELSGEETAEEIADMVIDLGWIEAA